MLKEIAIATFLLTNGGGGAVPTIPPVPESCLTVERVHEIAESRNDQIVVNSTDPQVIHPFALGYNRTEPVTDFEFKRLMIIQSPNPNIDIVVIILTYAEGPAEDCSVAATMPKDRALRLFAIGAGREA